MRLPLLSFVLGLSSLACGSSGGGGNASCTDGGVCPPAVGGGGSGGTGAITSGGSGGTGATTATGGTGAAPFDGGSGDCGTSSSSLAPKILSFGASLTSITQGESVTFSAVVTDPEGIDNLIGGTLRSANGITYGAFATTAQEGAYQLVVSWDDIDAAESITFPTGGSSSRTLVAEFFDEKGEVSSACAPLTLECGALAACSGLCTDVTSDAQNCGACGTVCDACDGGSCLKMVTSTQPVSCGDACLAQGASCTAMPGCKELPSYLVEGAQHCSSITCSNRQCGDVPASYVGGAPFSHAYCCCLL